MKNIVITGSLGWLDQRNIKEAIYNLIQKTNQTKINIISGGTGQGVDAYVKKYALEFGAEYHEIPPWHQQWTQYCLFEPFKYNKPFNKRNIYIRNQKLASIGDILIVFLSKDDADVLNDLICKFEKKDKKVVIFK